jgi:hypothetical protein
MDGLGMSGRAAVGSRSGMDRVSVSHLTVAIDGRAHETTSAACDEEAGHRLGVRSAPQG